MSLLDRKLIRDIAAMRWQVITIALVVAAGVAIFVSSVSPTIRCRRLTNAGDEMLRFRKERQWRLFRYRTIRFSIQPFQQVERVRQRIMVGGGSKREALKEPWRETA